MADLFVLAYEKNLLRYMTKLWNSTDFLLVEEVEYMIIKVKIYKVTC